MSNRAFKYSLEALLKKREWELTRLQQDEVQAHDVVDAMQKQLLALTEEIKEAEQRIRDATVNGSDINLSQDQSAREFLKHKRNEETEKQMALLKATEIHDRIFENLTKAHQSLLALQKHKEGQKNEFQTEQENKEFKESDNLWLSRR